MKPKSTKQVERELKNLFKKYGIEKKISVDEVKKWIWSATGPGMEAVNKYNKKCFKLFPEPEDIDELNDIMQIFTDAWNVFPHKELGGKSPEQIIAEETAKMPPEDQLKGNQMPKIRVGDREMDFDEFEAMLKEMEKAQKPFKKWIEKEALPKYRKYLEQMVKSKKIQENQYEVADIFFQRVLHVGFVDLEGIRSEFIIEEFPYWWPTHVMDSNLNPTQVRNALKRFFEFVELVYQIKIEKFGF